MTGSLSGLWVNFHKASEILVVSGKFKKRLHTHTHWCLKKSCTCECVHPTFITRGDCRRLHCRLCLHLHMQTEMEWAGMYFSLSYSFEEVFIMIYLQSPPPLFVLQLCGQLTQTSNSTCGFHVLRPIVNQLRMLPFLKHTERESGGWGVRYAFFRHRQPLPSVALNCQKKT